MLLSFLLCICCSLGRWLANPEHLACIDGTMALAFWVLLTATLIEDYRG